ncbi:GntR family transcriptional regulator [Lactococcus formosensis subsp. bovis]|uniref:GntR family transcriptional regulator n=1 Tax=Lactococcus TaxID=1357 RepID=UPI000776400E|nr:MULTISPECIES: GntR family transcriptional regulator [Lactococcus]KXT62585.1 Transcriptional regulator, GntR family [Lactococcus sp. DD01]
MRKYIKIVKHIKEKIAIGEYPVGSKIPRQEEFAEEFNTSRVTVSEAFKLLQYEGIIESIKGKGSYVTSAYFVRQHLSEMLPLSKLFPKSAYSKVVSFDIRPCDNLEKEKLKLKSNEEIYEIIRLRMIGERPKELEYTIMPVSLIPGVTYEVLENSIYEYIQKKLGLKIDKGVRIFRADTVDHYDMKYLNATSEGAIFEIEQVAYLLDGRHFEYSHTRFLHNSIEITSEVNLSNES